MISIRELRGAFGEWLNGIGWTSFLTMTARRTVSLYGGMRMGIRVIREIKPAADYFVVAEGAYGKTHHIHALLSGIDEAKIAEIRKAWKKRYGRILALPYNPELGARYYMTKYIKGERAEWDININKDRQNKLRAVPDLTLPRPAYGAIIKQQEVESA